MSTAADGARDQLALQLPNVATALEKSTTDGRIISLEYLRGSAALAVALSHFGAYHAIDGDLFEAISAVAVEIFFVLSGFVLAPQVLFVTSSARWRNLGTFLIRRWMRTILPYLVALCAMTALVGQFGSADFLRYAFYVQNLDKQLNHFDYYSVAWSLSVEEWFYLAFPLFIFLSMRACGIASTSLALRLGVAFVVAISLLRFTMGDMQHWGPDVRRTVLFRIDSIAWGFVLYILSKERRFGGPLAWFIVMLLAGGLSVWITILAEQGIDVAKQLFPFVTAAFGSSTILLALAIDAVGGKTEIATRCGLLLGRTSYSIYLFHTIFLAMLRPSLEGMAIVAQLVAYLALCFSFSIAFFYSFERPILAARPRY
jgi:peptidoglycan/LPS O-acetylase OafA/YrhL